MSRRTNYSHGYSRSFYSESHQPLHSPFSQPKQRIYDRVKSLFSCDRLRLMCITSKAAVFILFWTVIVGAVYNLITGVVHFVLLFTFSTVYLNVPLTYIVLYFFVAVFFMLYPLCGFMADVYFGRFKTIMISLCLVLCFLIVFLTGCAILVYCEVPPSWTYFINAINCFCLLCIVLGAAGYGANYIQFGLDQLFDAPSYHQTLFVHWAVWSYELCSIAFTAMLATYMCFSSPSYNAFFLSLFILPCLLLISLLLGYWKRHWFYSQPGQNNPIKVIAKVLSFTWKHKYPLQRSAFTYCDDERPSRLDFAKERFGGPFSTEQVEDVKTFIRIIGLLVVVGTAYVIDVPSSTISLLFVGQHITLSQLGQPCFQWKWILINSGLLRCIVRAVFLPIYIYCVLLKKRVPRILLRLGVGIVIYLLGILSLVIIDSVGHTYYLISGNDTQCIFNLQTNSNITLLLLVIPDHDDYSIPAYTVPSLNMHWSVLIPSNIFFGIGQVLVTATTFEFISAQSPHFIKGFLLGTFFAIMGIFQFIGSVAVAPLTSKSTWFNDHPLGISCLTTYCITICSIVLVGFALFSIMAKRYKLRERDDRPYDQRFVIDVYNWYLNQETDSDTDWN